MDVDNQTAALIAVTSRELIWALTAWKDGLLDSEMAPSGSVTFWRRQPA